MTELLPILHGYNTIQLYRKVGGVNLWPHTIQWEVCGNTLVDEASFQRFNQDRWLMAWAHGVQSYYAVRNSPAVNGQAKFRVTLSREILGLTAVSSEFADHRNHDTLDNTLDNLRVATRGQNVANGRLYNSLRFKGVMRGRRGKGYQAHIMSGGVHVYFRLVEKDIEAGLMYFYAATVLHGEFKCVGEFPEDEMPTEERQQELWEMVLEKLRQKGLK